MWPLHISNHERRTKAKYIQNQFLVTKQLFERDNLNKHKQNAIANALNILGNSKCYQSRPCRLISDSTEVGIEIDVWLL